VYRFDFCIVPFAIVRDGVWYESHRDFFVPLPSAVAFVRVRVSVVILPPRDDDDPVVVVVVDTDRETIPSSLTWALLFVLLLFAMMKHSLLHPESKD
jgi:hypothetical protein